MKCELNQNAALETIQRYEKSIKINIEKIALMKQQILLLKKLINDKDYQLLVHSFELEIDRMQENISELVDDNEYLLTKVLLK